MGAKSCELNAMKMTVMGHDANLTTSLIKEGGVHTYSNRRHYPPLLKINTHTYTHTYTTTKSKTKHLNSSAYTSINQRADDKTYKHILH